MNVIKRYIIALLVVLSACINRKNPTEKEIIEEYLASLKVPQNTYRHILIMPQCLCTGCAEYFLLDFIRHHHKDSVLLITNSWYLYHHTPCYRIYDEKDRMVHNIYKKFRFSDYDALHIKWQPHKNTVDTILKIKLSVDNLSE